MVMLRTATFNDIIDEIGAEKTSILCHFFKSSRQKRFSRCLECHSKLFFLPFSAFLCCIFFIYDRIFQ